MPEMKRRVQRASYWSRFRYKHLSLFLLNILIVVFLMQFQFFHDALHSFGKLGYWGALIGGILYVSTFTAPIGILILIALGETLPIVPLSLIAGIGGVLGDLVIFNMVRSTLKEELSSLYYMLGGHFVSKLFSKKTPLGWLVPVLGAVVVASPFPDEIGVSMMGVSKMSTSKFLVLSLFLDSVGVCLLVFFGKGSV